jgi:aconitate hydratase
MRWPARSQKDLTKEPLGRQGRQAGLPQGHLADLGKEIQEFIEKNVTASSSRSKYADVFKGDANWAGVKAPEGQTYAWDDKSTYVQNPPYFVGMKQEPGPVTDIKGARILGLFGDKITTDHISPGRLDQGGVAGRQVPHRQWRRRRRLQPVRHAPRQP